MMDFSNTKNEAQKLIIEKAASNGTYYIETDPASKIKLISADINKLESDLRGALYEKDVQRAQQIERVRKERIHKMGRFSFSYLCHEKWEHVIFPLGNMIGMLMMYVFPFYYFYGVLFGNRKIYAWEESELSHIEARCKEEKEILRRQYEERIKELRAMSFKEKQRFDLLVEEYSEKAILASKGYQDLIDYTYQQFMHLLLMQNHDETTAFISVKLCVRVCHQAVEYFDIQDRYIASYGFYEHHRLNLETEAERHGFAWALMTLIEIKIKEKHQGCNIVMERTDNVVAISCSLPNSNYIAPKNLF